MSRQLTFAEKSELQRHFAAQRGAAKQGDMVEWVRAAFGKNVGRSSIGRILGESVDATLRPQRLRRRISDCPRAEAALLAFVGERVAQNELERIGDDVLWEMARAAAADAGERRMSMSWIQRFKARNSVRADRRSLLLLTGENGAGARAELVMSLARNRDEVLKSIAAKEAATAARAARLLEQSHAAAERSVDDAEKENATDGEGGGDHGYEPEASAPEQPPLLVQARASPTRTTEQSPAPFASPPARSLGAFASPPGRSSIGSRRVSLSSNYSSSGGGGGGGGDELEWESERRRRAELEEREAELRVESLRCDNVLKRIKIMEESMLARKRLKDAGISESELDVLIPVVAVQHPELDATSGLRQLRTLGQTPEKQS